MFFFAVSFKRKPFIPVFRIFNLPLEICKWFPMIQRKDQLILQFSFRNNHLCKILHNLEGFKGLQWFNPDKTLPFGIYLVKVFYDK